MGNRATHNHRQELKKTNHHIDHDQANKKHQQKAAREEQRHRHMNGGKYTKGSKKGKGKAKAKMMMLGSANGTHRVPYSICATTNKHQPSQ